jgi:Ser/Thr protein kinase RdoA (MazF antagonist)
MRRGCGNSSVRGARSPGTNIARLEAGYQNDIFRVAASNATPETTWVLSVCAPATTTASVECEHRLLISLAGDRTPSPIATAEGSTFVDADFAGETRVCWLTRFFDGVSPNREAAADRTAAAKALGALHHDLAALDLRPRPDRPAFVDLDWRESQWWSWSQRGSSGLSDEQTRQVRGPIDPVGGELARLSRLGWPTQPLHGDFHPGNLQIDRGRITAIFDWDEARVDWPAWDAADAMWSFCSDAGRTALDHEAASVFLEAYERARGKSLLQSERTELTTLVRLRRLWEALYGLGEAQRELDIDAVYLNTNLTTIEALT